MPPTATALARNLSNFESVLSSSENENLKIAAKQDQYRLEDSSSDDYISTAFLPHNKSNSAIADLSAAIETIQINEERKISKIFHPPSKLNESELWSTDEEEDSALENRMPSVGRKSRSILLDDSDDESLTSSPRSPIDRPTRKWRYSTGRKEYIISKVSDARLPSFRIPRCLFDKLYTHQKEGVAWMAGLHVGGIGGLLGDDMGMGKTYQTLTFLGGMMRARTIRNTIILAPLSVLRSWEKEAQNVIKMCVSNVCIKVVSGDIKKTSRQRIFRAALECTPSRPHLIITTYGLVRTSLDDCTHESFDWDYVILDEAHNIKNSTTAAAKNVRILASGARTRRLILTGTPIMNNLNELWALFDFVASGKLLGPSSSFKTNFAIPIESARSKDATSFEIEAGRKAQEDLQEKLKPYLLQRLKVECMAEEIPTKRDFVIWTHLSEKQRNMYSEYVNSKDSAVADVLSGIKTSPLEAITWLKKLCGHPILVSPREQASLATDVTPSVLLQDSAKLQVLDALVVKLRSDGHRVLIFSQSTKMLDIIQRVLLARFIGLSRIDGKTKENDRQRLVDEFNAKASSAGVMLLSTGAGGVGLTLTGADTAIVFDPSWNPASDAQAVDRCYRIGQKKEVSIYRLIAAGTVEEKMYEKQVHKDGIRRAVVTNKGDSLARYFAKDDLRQVFKLNPHGRCDFLDRLGYSFGGERPSPTFHVGVIGISSQDVLYSEDAIDGGNQNPQDVNGESQENPFSSPSKATSFPLDETNPHSDLPRLKNAKTVGKAQRALMKEGSSGDALIAVGALNDKTSKAKSEMKNTKVFGGGDLTRAFREVDQLCSNARLEDAMEILMNTIDRHYESLSKADKLRLHNRISSIASELRWL